MSMSSTKNILVLSYKFYIYTNVFPPLINSSFCAPIAWTPKPIALTGLLLLYISQPSVLVVWLLFFPPMWPVTARRCAGGCVQAVERHAVACNVWWRLLMGLQRGDKWASTGSGGGNRWVAEQKLIDRHLTSRMMPRPDYGFNSCS